MESASSPPTVSIVVCASEEGRSLRPCLNAWLAAVAAFKRIGGRAHIVVSVFGDVARTREETTRLTNAGVELVVADGKTIGEALNRGVELARHDIVVVADGADLVPSTTIVDMVEELQSAAENVILHPAAVLRFGRLNDEWRPTDMRTRAGSAGDILCHDPWPLVAFARRTVFQQVNYRELSTGWISAPPHGPGISTPSHADSFTVSSNRSFSCAESRFSLMGVQTRSWCSHRSMSKRWARHCHPLGPKKSPRDITRACRSE